VIPAGGGKALRLAANDPPACSGKSSPGVNNHWGKWAPQVQSANGRTYYWVLFSSSRADLPPVPRNGECPNEPPCDPNISITQLYISVVVDDGHGLKSYPAIYLWNQPTDTLNMTPIWENLSIPRVVD
jgi:hypothetical protein